MSKLKPSVLSGLKTSEIKLVYSFKGRFWKPNFFSSSCTCNNMHLEHKAQLCLDGFHLQYSLANPLSQILILCVHEPFDSLLARRGLGTVETTLEVAWQAALDQSYASFSFTKSELAHLRRCSWVIEPWCDLTNLLTRLLMTPTGSFFNWNRG